jgi:hypothetical protein
VTEGNAGPVKELEDILRRLEVAREELIETLQSTDGALFEKQKAGGSSIKTTLERTADDVNFYYGRLTARALTLPQPPCMNKAEFMSLREATISLQVAHRRFSNLLHKLIPEDLEKKTTGDDHGEYTLRQVLEMAAAHYRLRRQQVQTLAEGAPKRRRKAPESRP